MRIILLQESEISLHYLVAGANLMRIILSRESEVSAHYLCAPRKNLFIKRRRLFFGTARSEAEQL